MLPNTSERVPNQTSSEINQRIRRETQERVASYQHASAAEIDQLLRELDEEWDIERTLEMNASTLAFIGCTLAATRDRRWLALPMAVTAFLFQHAVHGWCPPLPILRRMGFRTMREIDEERIALKAMRGDFRGVSKDYGDRAVDALTAARR